MDDFAARFEEVAAALVPGWPGFSAASRLQSRVFLAEAVLRDARKQPWRVRDYQGRSLESRAPRKVHVDGRDVGKTTEILVIALWASLALPGRQMMIATQTENQLFPLMNRLGRLYESLAGFEGGLAEKRQSPSWHFRFRNGFELWGRIAGPRGTNFQGMHADFQIVDEAQEMTGTAWSELYQALNGGGWRWVYGVPNGLRNDFYRMSEMEDYEQFRWPSRLNPDFTDAKDAELARLYGGRHSTGYINRVLGEHGAPAHGVFDLDDYLECVSDSVSFEEAVLSGEEPFEAPEQVARGDYYLGCDLGYARDPSEFVVYRSEPPHLLNVQRVRLEGVHYARQLEVICALDRAYGFRAVGIDCGNNGRAVAHQLMALGGAWCQKVHAIDFGASIELPPLPDGRPARRRAKEFMTELLRDYMRTRVLVFPRLPDRESQYAAHTYRVNPAEQVIYEKGHDHLIDADRCAMLAHYRDTNAYFAPQRMYSAGMPIYLV